jgi:phosphoribosylanthranilate isomerase
MTKIKICGIKTLSDAIAAVDTGADLLGFNFYPKSVRFIEMQACAEITFVLKQGHPSIQLVGVFVNSPMSEVKMIMETCLLDFAQLHGDETPEFCMALGSRAFKAFRGVANAKADKRMIAKRAPAFLIDAAVNDVYGGTGLQADWSAAAELSRRYPLLLAGGLKPENVAAAVQQVKPWGVDVASGVESRPGEKDAVKMKAFVDAVHSVQIEAEA